jgi:hypothetical protein
MEDIVQEAPSRFQVVGKSQDKIGWRRFLKGMISKEITGIQQQYHSEVVLWTYHKVAGNYARAMNLSKLYCA